MRGADVGIAKLFAGHEVCLNRAGPSGRRETLWRGCAERVVRVVRKSAPWPIERRRLNVFGIVEASSFDVWVQTLEVPLPT